MTIVRYQTFKAWAEYAKTEERKIFEVTPTWRADNGGIWAAVLPELKEVGFSEHSAELAIKDMLKRNGWHVMQVKPTE